MEAVQITKDEVGAEDVDLCSDQSITNAYQALCRLTEARSWTTSEDLANNLRALNTDLSETQDLPERIEIRRRPINSDPRKGTDQAYRYYTQTSDLEAFIGMIAEIYQSDRSNQTGAMKKLMENLEHILFSKRKEQQPLPVFGVYQNYRNTGLKGKGKQR
jgi:hypothetical protein